MSKKRNNKKKRTLMGIIIVLLVVATGTTYVLYRLNYIPHMKFTNEYFHIDVYTSLVDKDSDGTDDQSDILQNVREYIKTNPKYKSQYYSSGYPNDEYGVCTDVVAFGLFDAGYDLQKLVDSDIIKNPHLYDIEKRDKTYELFDKNKIINAVYKATIKS